jgi:hypothetical protein
MKSSLPRVRREALRDTASAELVERLWQRLEHRAPGRSVPRAQLPWAAGLAAVAFVAGVWVGGSPMGLQAVVTAPVAESVAHPQPASGALASRAEPLPTPPVKLGTPAQTRTLRRSASSEQAALTAPGIAPPTPAAQAGAVLEPQEPPWLELANLGEYQRSLEALEASGGFHAVLGAASADRLMAMADLARATGRRAWALQALRAVVERHAESPEAPLAAWTLGNMLEQAGDQAGAAWAYAWYRRLSPRGEFAEDAVVRQLEALVAQGQLDQARQLARSYEPMFPSSLRLRELLLELEPSSTEAQQRGTPAPQEGEDASVEHELSP